MAVVHRSCSVEVHCDQRDRFAFATCTQGSHSFNARPERSETVDDIQARRVVSDRPALPAAQPCSVRCDVSFREIAPSTVER